MKVERVLFMVIAMACVPITTALGEDLSGLFASERIVSKVLVDHSAWADILGRNLLVDPEGINRFAYGKVTAADRSKLQSYIAGLQKIDPRQLRPNEQRAYWINFYNALTIEVILQHYPVESIRDISSGVFTRGPWDIPLVTVNGKRLTLNNIEHDILRTGWRDERVHYALNCASLGCPDLAATPYEGKLLDAQLDAAGVAFINHSRGVSLRNGRLILSSIFDWYRKDFDGGAAPAVIGAVRKYARPQLAARLGRLSRIDGYQYDWRLNAPGKVFLAPQ